MAGYYGFSMSNNAISAYESGEMPISKWTKGAILEAIENAEVELNFNIDLLKKVAVKQLKALLLYKTSWYHTSSHYNRTDFYSLDLDMVEELTNEKIKNMIANKKEEKKEEPTEEKWKCTFLEWSGSRKHPKATEITEVGTIKGNWFYRTDGSKKSTNANGFRFIEKI